MDMPEVKGMDMVEGQDHPMNHRLGEEGMNMMKMNGIDTMEGMDMVEEHFHPMNHRSEVESMDTADTAMWEDRATELEVVEREPEGVVLVRYWTGEASPNSLRVGGACKTGVFKRSTHICNSGLQL
jgi:hypothetical protein